MLCRLACDHIYARSLLKGKRHAANGGLCLLLDLCLGLGCAVPMAEEEASVLHALLELVV